VTFTGLSLSPDGQLVAVVALETREPGAGSETKGHPSVLAVIGAKGDELWRDKCVSSRAGWVERPLRLVYGVRRDGGVTAVAANPVTGEAVLASEVLPADTIGPVAGGDDRAAFVAFTRDGGAELAVWALGANKLSHWSVPGFFVASSEMPPAVSATGRYVAITSGNRGTLAVCDTAAGHWLTPVAVTTEATEGKLIWDWRPLTSESLASGSWREGSWQDRDRFLVDEKGLAAWAVLANAPPGATPAPGGRLRVIFTHDQVVPLDLESRRAAWEDTGVPSGFPRVWSSYLAALSSDARMSSVCVLYKADGSADCVLYSRGEHGQWAETVVRRDEHVQPDLLSLCKDGSRLAICLDRNATKEVQVIRADTKRAVIVWRP
jgi:hypothetical protein